MVVSLKILILLKFQLKHLDLIDVTFDKCDLSNQNFDHQYLNRVQFKNCKLTGTSFIETNLKDVLFDHCQGRYSKFIIKPIVKCYV